MFRQSDFDALIAALDAAAGGAVDRARSNRIVEIVEEKHRYNVAVVEYVKILAAQNGLLEVEPTETLHARADEIQSISDHLEAEELRRW